jgi:AcrR family transcriptional regulator
MHSSSSCIQQPQQTRSRETMNLILDAAGQILEIKNFEELTIAEVVHRAGTSVGAFYGRFKDKEALLQTLDERFFNEFDEAVIALLAPKNWLTMSISSIVTDVTNLIVQTYSKDKGVLRSLNLKSRLTNDSSFKTRELSAWNELFPQFQIALLSHQEEITHPNPRLAIRLGFQQMFFCTREILLWAPLREDITYTSEELVSELARAYLAYLGVQESSQTSN